MKRIVSVAVLTLIGLGHVLGQTSPNSTGKKADQKQGAAVSDQELNLEAYTELLRTDLRNARSQIVGQVMHLDATQSAAFWPIYKQFEADYSKIGDRILALVKNYTDNYYAMTDEVADQLANQLLDIEQQRNALKKQYYPKFKRAVGAINGARFLEVQNQLDSITDLQISSRLPVVREGGSNE